MEIFYIVTLSVAVILLIIILTYLGLKMSNDTSAVGVFPPNKMMLKKKLRPIFKNIY